jgi:hypothetical protein
VTRDERSLASVPGWLWLFLVIALAAQISFQGPRPSGKTGGLPPAPSVQALRLASFGEREALARVLVLYVQSHDEAPDYERLTGWLQNILELDPRSQYPLFLAARVYAENRDPRRALDFVYQAFFRDPDRRWPALAHAALVAKHRLGDLPLARRYAAAVQRFTTSPDVPLWAKQMEIFILEDMNELEAARIMLGGLIDSGTVRDPGELRFLRQRLEDLEARIGSAK